MSNLPDAPACLAVKLNESKHKPQNAMHKTQSTAQPVIFPRQDQSLRESGAEDIDIAGQVRLCLFIGTLSPANRGALFKNTHDVFVPRGLLEFSKRRVCIEADANQHVVRRFKLSAKAKIDPILPFAAWHEEDLAR